jgi:hypothetical protein
MQCEEIDMHITESWAMIPGAAVSGFYFAHPQSKYFSVGKIGDDQVTDMAARRGVAKKKSNAGWHRICNSLPSCGRNRHRTVSALPQPANSRTSVKTGFFCAELRIFACVSHVSGHHPRLSAPVQKPVTGARAVADVRHRCLLAASAFFTCGCR